MNLAVPRSIYLNQNGEQKISLIVSASRNRPASIFIKYMQTCQGLVTKSQRRANQRKTRRVD